MRYLVFKDSNEIVDSRKFSEHDFKLMKDLLSKFCDFCPFQNKMGCDECPTTLSFEDVAEALAPDVRIIVTRERR